MIHKDKYKDSEYFLNYIDEQKRRITKFKKVLDGCGDSEKKKICLIIGSRLKDLISAQFSANESVSAITASFEEYAECILVTGFSSYSEYVDFLSMQIILGVDDISIVAPVEYSDDLVCILSNYISNKDNVLTGHLCFPDYYGVFKDYGINSIGFNQLMDYMSNKWYTSSVNMYWFGSHLRDNDTYVGYWNYVASALIRVRGDYDKLTEEDRFIV